METIKTNIRNRILTKEEILEIGKERMKKLKSNYPEQISFQLVDFHNEANKIESWMGEKFRRIKKWKS